MSEYIYGGETEKRADTQIYKCNGCGADMRFDPKSQDLVCDHCGSKQPLLANTNVRPVEYVGGATPEDDLDKESRVFSCPNCGGKTVLAAGEIAKSCPFCGATHVIATEELAGVKPTAVLPFLYTEEEAKEKFVAWVKKRWFVPNALKKQAKVTAASGVYSPIWIFDCNTFSSYTGVLGKYVTRTVGSGKNRRTVTEIRWFSVSGNYNMDYNNIMVEASPHFSQAEFNALKPFALERTAVYDKRYLAGFTAAHYDKTVDDAWLDAAKIVDADLRNRIKEEYNADVVKTINLSTRYEARRYRYTLLPLYLSNYRFKNKTYRFMVNGSTGKISGKVPRSAVKISFTVLIGLALIGLLVWFVLSGNDSGGLNNIIGLL